MVQFWEGEWPRLAAFSLPRFYRQVDELPVNIQPHVLGDASALAFCSVCYLRMETAQAAQNPRGANEKVEHPMYMIGKSDC